MESSVLALQVEYRAPVFGKSFSHRTQDLKGHKGSIYNLVSRPTI